MVPQLRGAPSSSVNKENSLKGQGNHRVTLRLIQMQGLPDRGRKLTMTNMLKDRLGKLGNMHTKGNNSRDMKMPEKKDTVTETISASLGS